MLQRKIRQESMQTAFNTIIIHCNLSIVLLIGLVCLGFMAYQPLQVI